MTILITAIVTAVVTAIGLLEFGRRYGERSKLTKFIQETENEVNLLDQLIEQNKSDAAVFLSRGVWAQVREARVKAGGSIAHRTQLENMEARNDEVRSRMLKIMLARAGVPADLIRSIADPNDDDHIERQHRA
jgi:hypothetical protein